MIMTINNFFKIFIILISSKFDVFSHIFINEETIIKVLLVKNPISKKMIVPLIHVNNWRGETRQHCIETFQSAVTVIFFRQELSAGLFGSDQPHQTFGDSLMRMLLYCWLSRNNICQ